MTVSESRRELTDRFRSSGVESPEVNAELLLASLLNCSRTELPLRLDETIPNPQIEHLNSQAVRRAKREPLQHILGTACFCGLEFQVTPAVLVPRPETEELIELAFETAKTMPCPVIYDFGTGSGCIAVTLAKRLAKVTAMQPLPVPKSYMTGQGIVFAVSKASSISSSVSGRGTSTAGVT